MLPSIPQLIILLAIFLLVLLPIILVLKSDLVSGGEKFLWVVAAILFSWLGFIAFKIVESRKRRTQAASNKDHQ